MTRRTLAAILLLATGPLLLVSRAESANQNGSGMKLLDARADRPSTALVRHTDGSRLLVTVDFGAAPPTRNGDGMCLRTHTLGAIAARSVDSTPPTATIARDMVTATNQDCLAWSVDFSESVGSSFTPADVTPTGTLAAGAQVFIGGDDPNHLVLILLDNANANGTIGFTIPAGVVADTSGNPYAGGSGPAYTINNTLFTQLSGDVNKNGTVDISDVALLGDANLGLLTLP